MANRLWSSISGLKKTKGFCLKNVKNWGSHDLTVPISTSMFALCNKLARFLGFIRQVFTDTPPSATLFAALASLCSANELVKLLNRLYARFDHIAHVSRNDARPVCDVALCCHSIPVMFL